MVLAVALLSSSAVEVGAAHQHDVRVTGAYVNHNYGFSIAVPKGCSAWRNAAPGPDHGVEIDLGSSRTLTVSAEFNALDYPSLNALLSGELDSSPPAKHMRMTLAGAPALRGGVSKGAEREVVVVRQDGRDVDAINFILDLNTTAKAERVDERVMESVLASFRVIPRR